jgi:hypothetical protein
MYPEKKHSNKNGAPPKKLLQDCLKFGRIFPLKKLLSRILAGITTP